MPIPAHREVVASLTKVQRERLLAKSNTAGLGYLAVHLGALALTTTLLVAHVPVWPLVMVAQGILINFLFTTLHETVHRTPFRSRWLNDAVGRMCGFLLLLGPEHFRLFHMAHHRYTNEPGLDPELSAPRPATRWQYFRYLSGIPEWRSRVATLLITAVRGNRDQYVPERSKSTVRREAFALVASYVALAGLSALASNAVLVFTWVLPLVLGGPFLRGYLLAEHAGCPHQASMFVNTRTMFTNAAVRRLAWNMPFHVEHHSFPAVPFHQLPAFHEHTQKHLAYTENGYVRFNREYVRTSGHPITKAGL